MLAFFIPLGALLTTVALGKRTAWKAGRAIGWIDVVYVDGVVLEMEQAGSWLRMKAQAARDGVTLKASSGFRTMARQAELHAAYQAGKSLVVAAPPGYSNHQNGTALDIEVQGSTQSAAFRWLAKNGHRFGWSNDEGARVNEPWHWVYSATLDPSRVRGVA